MPQNRSNEDSIGNIGKLMCPVDNQLSSLMRESVSLMRKFETRCNVGASDGKQNLPTIYAITPTFTRPVQKAELTRFVSQSRILNS
jgi:hypothetical protein